jgi:ABC-type uncharacterized transport system auxiliary subunit
MKKLIFVVIALLMLSNCGYTPIYSSKNNNFSIDISQKNRSKLNSKIENNIKKFSNENNENIIQIEISSNKKINIISKDEKGDPSRFSMKISLTVNIFNKNNYEINKTKIFTEKFDYKNYSNKFSLKQYEKDIEDNLINKIIERSIIYLAEL